MSTQRVDIFSPSSVALQIHACRPQTTGDDQARPGIRVRQTTFFVGDQVRGSRASAALASPAEAVAELAFCFAASGARQVSGGFDAAVIIVENQYG